MEEIYLDLIPFAFCDLLSSLELIVPPLESIHKVLIPEKDAEQAFHRVDIHILDSLFLEKVEL